ncbi:MAG: histidinol dehydrogenase [SAR202 cluster bacterium]|nr:histidinol dehydrogenase [SAR202 cluster bacterium]
MKVIYGIQEGLEVLSRELFFSDQMSNNSIEESIFKIFGRRLTPNQVVSEILSEVAKTGDEALKRYTKMIDGVDLQDIVLNKNRILEEISDLNAEVFNALRISAQRVKEFHMNTVPESWFDEAKGYGEVIRPVEKVGIYIPGGRASYPSTVLMTAIPARVAGVKEVFLATPSTGQAGINSDVLAAAHVANVDQVFNIGGAQAIAAFAYGTDTIPKVDMICGPGNLFVTIAKKMVYGQVGIDGLAGPTETLIVADDTADPRLCAADLLGQAEHDLLATPVLITTSESLVSKIMLEIDKQMESLSKKETASASIENRGVIVVVDAIDDALAIANSYAPEHLCLMIEEPWSSIDKVSNAGGVFLGENSPEVMGDYIAGPSHVMPTGGTARFNSSLGIAQFIRRTPVVSLSQSTVDELAETAVTLARLEGFDAHALAVELRVNSE